MTSSTIPNQAVDDKISVAVERHFWLFAWLFAVLFLTAAIAIDIRTKLWMDEILTLHMAQQGGPGEIVKATLDGCDNSPPLYAMIVHAILPWVRNEALAVRLPATLGYCGMVLLVLAFCQRRFPAVYAWAAALLACNAFLGYSTEGRSYGLVMAFAAAALVCWQAAADGSRRVVALPMLAFCVGVMTALHYYSIFFVVPLFVAEVARWRKSGKLDFPILASLTLPVLVVLGLHYPFIAASKRFQGHYWQPPLHWGQAPDLYFSYFLTMFLLPLVLLAVFSRTLDREERPSNLTTSGWVATYGFLVMPLCVIVLSKYTTHAFLPRYALWAVPAIAVLVTALLCAAVRGKAIVGASMVVILVALISLQEVIGLVRKPVLRQSDAVRQELLSLPDSSEPIVVANTHVFLELSYYLAPPLRDRLIYPVSQNLDLRYHGFDTDALMMSALSHRTQLQIIGYDAVLTAHPHFVLAATPQDYLPSHLVEAGYRVLPISSSQTASLYEVEAPATK